MTGTARYRKLYDLGQCLRIVVNPSETNCYFARSVNDVLGVADINCEDGSVNNFYVASGYTILNSKFYMGISNTGNTIFMSGSIKDSSLKFNHCRYNVNSSPKLQ